MLCFLNYYSELFAIIFFFKLKIQDPEIFYPWPDFTLVLLGHNSCYLRNMREVVNDPG